MQRPDFLIIGAMKAGTTTLYRDLYDHPGIFLPEEKEPDVLVRNASDLEAIGADYDQLLAGATPGQIRGEASTAYTKRPDHEGVAERAREICGPDLKLIYLMRDPFDRAISQYKHEYGLGYISEPMGEALLTHERFAAYSRYDYQLEPWRAAFPEAQLLCLDFKTYTGDRAGTVAQVCRFLGVDPEALPAPKTDRAFNVSGARPDYGRGLGKIIVNSTFYQRQIKPRVPWQLRDRIASAILPTVRKADGTLSPQDAQAFRDRL